MRGPAGASPDARAAGGVGQSQGRGRGGREDESPKYAGGEGEEEAMEQLEAAGWGFALPPCPVSVEKENGAPGSLLGPGFGARWCQRGLGRTSMDVDGRGISTRGDCVTACGSALLPACMCQPSSHPSALPGIPAQAPVPSASLPPGTAHHREMQITGTGRYRKIRGSWNGLGWKGS